MAEKVVQRCSGFTVLAGLVEKYSAKELDAIFDCRVELDRRLIIRQRSRPVLMDSVQLAAPDMKGCILRTFQY